MIDWSLVNSIKKNKQEIEIKLDELIKSGSSSEDEIKGLKAEILHFEKEIARILGRNELDRIKRIKHQRSNLEQKNINGYYTLKTKYEKISKFSIALSRLENAIKNRSIEEKHEVVKVKV